jgi:uncharacterized protein DUF5916/cellulose/xylan binding protein with CBM9 domain
MYHRSVAVATVLIPSFFFLTNIVHAQAPREFHVRRAVEPPKIDGDLGDDVWDDDPLSLGDWISYDPIYGERMTQRTEVRVAYDDRNLYFSFHCFDTEPGKIRTTISRRDSISSDDWVGFSLDSNGTGQTSYHMIVNPSGIQMDALNTPASREQWEADMVWDSAGRRTEDGYIVEIKLPLQSIRFTGGSVVKMGILFWRHISRTGVSAAWPDIPPGEWVFNRHAHLVLSDLKQPKLIEVLPSITYAINQNRATPNAWNNATGKADIGLTMKYGITSSITLDATINPDFSQVESDAFQVQVNQRFPVFYSEKRPFFMEGMGLFNLAGTGGEGNMAVAAHTRRIIDPTRGSKVTGTAGKLTFGILSASDANPEDIGDRGAAIIGRNKLFTIGRATYALGESDYFGAIVTDTEHAGRHNRVVGSDLSLRFTRRQQFSTTILSSQTGITGEDTAHGVAAQMSYNYSDRKFVVSGQVEHYGKDFQMDTAFYNRTGFTSGWGYGELNFYPQETGNSWLKRTQLFTWTKYGRDQIQNGNEGFVLTGMRLNFTRQGFFRIDKGWGHEPWTGRQFKNGDSRISGQVQIFRWLNISGRFTNGWAIYYDPHNPFQGRSTTASAGFTLQPNAHINQSISYDTVRFDRASSGDRVYTVHIINVRSTYQFSRHFLVRAIEQFDNSRNRLLTDLLASYEFVPGTVFHAGYGSLYEKRAGNYLTTSRGLFFKASYLHRF